MSNRTRISIDLTGVTAAPAAPAAPVLGLIAHQTVLSFIRQRRAEFEQQILSDGLQLHCAHRVVSHCRTSLPHPS